MTTAKLTLEPKSKIFGIVGVIAAFLGLLSILVGPAICNAVIPPQSAKQQLAETVIGIKHQITAVFKKTPPPPETPRQRFSPQELPDTLSLAFSALAIIGGAVSYLRREDHRYAYVACGLGTATLIWHAFLLAFAAALLCVILYYVLPDALS